MRPTGFRPTLHFAPREDGVYVVAKEPEYGPKVFWYYPAYGGTFWYPRERGMLILATDQISDEEFKYLYESLSDSFGIVEVVPGLMMVDTSFPATPTEEWELYRD